MNTYFNQVLKAFSEMDSGFLSDLLEPKYTYQEVSLEIFIEDLEGVFQEFRDEGDTHLEILPGTCGNIFCNPDYIRTAYRFVGDNTRNYLDFRFITEITEDQKDYAILDIFHCNSLQCHVKKDWYGSPKYLTSLSEQEKSETIDPERILHFGIAEEAFMVFSDASHKVTFEELNAWLLKYRSTYDFLDSVYFEEFSEELQKWEEFLQMYSRLDSYFHCFNELNSKGLLKEKSEVSSLSENSLIELVCEIEDVIIACRLEVLLDIFNKSNNFQIWYNNVYLGGHVFEQFVDVLKWFLPCQKLLVEKYFSLNESETDAFLESEDIIDPDQALRLLTFHMEIRKKARDRKDYIYIKDIDIDLEKF